LKKFALVLLSLFAAVSCGTGNPRRYQAEFFLLFDTHTTFIAYTQTESEFELYLDIIHSTMENLHMQFDIYNNYEGISNLKTINDNAGLSPVTFSREIIDLLLLGKECYVSTNGTVNIALGSVLQLWRDARDSDTVPSIAQLEEAFQNTDINNIIIDEQLNTVFLTNPGMSLDAGAIAKGFAMERAVRLAAEAGLVSGLINSGGDVITVGSPLDGRDYWNVGIQDPFNLDAVFDTITVNGTAIASSGDYRRQGHIIDPATLFPANRFAGVSVIHPNAQIAEMLSTALFILPFEEGLKLAEDRDAQVIGIYHDGSSETY
jgi:thiamine biosynthesis lipoprotein